MILRSLSPSSPSPSPVHHRFLQAPNQHRLLLEALDLPSEPPLAKSPAFLEAVLKFKSILQLDNKYVLC